MKEVWSEIRDAESHRRTGTSRRGSLIRGHDDMIRQREPVQRDTNPTGKFQIVYTLLVLLVSFPVVLSLSLALAAVKSHGRAIETASRQAGSLACGMWSVICGHVRMEYLERVDHI